MPGPQDDGYLPISGLSGESAKLASILQRLDQGVVLQGPKAEILFANQAAMDMLGLTEDQILGRTSFDEGWHAVRADGSDFPGPEHPVPVAIAQRRPVRDVLMGVHRPKTQDTVWLEVSAIPELDADGRVLNVACCFTDVSERRQAQDDLQREHELLRQVMATSVAGILVYDPSGRIAYANRAAERTLGLTKGDPGARAYDPPPWRRTTLDGAPLPEEARPFVRVLATRAPVFNIRYRLVWPDDRVKAIEVHGAPVLDAGGAIELLVFAVHDITDELRAKEEQEKVDEQMERLARQESLSILAGGIAHDFNNLLVGMLTASDLAREEIPPDHAAEAHLKLISRTAQRAAELTRQLLAYSGRGQFVVERIDMSTVAREMLEIAGMLSREVSLQLDLQDGLPSIQADAIQVKQILLNLLLNAADATRDTRGYVKLSTGLVNATAATLREANTAGEQLDPGPYVYAEVDDTGTGMAPETLQRIFDPFFTTKEDGHGLGLAAVLGVLRGHGGFVEAESTVGVGTRLRVAFPAIEAPASYAAVKTPLPQLQLSLPGTVLVIDDEPMVRTVAQRLLQRRDVAVLTAEDGHDGLRLFAEHRHQICAVILDLTMPGMTGDEVLHQLRADRPDLPVLLMSGYSQHEVEAPDPRTRFVAKPFRAQALMDGLHEVVFGR